jgi:hypothetical protein
MVEIGQSVWEKKQIDRRKKESESERTTEIQNQSAIYDRRLVRTVKIQNQSLLATGK